MLSFFFRNTAPRPTENKYFELILQAHRSKPTNNQPHPGDVLFQLMALYHKTASEAYYYGIPVSTSGLRHQHDQHAQKCLERLKSKDAAGIKQVIYYLNDVENIAADGDFALLLSTFFSAYPKYLTHCNASLLTITTPRNIWLESHAAWLQQLRQPGTNNHFNHYERYEQVASVTPKHMADEYADELLATLDAKLSDCYHGLLNGWLFLALGKLADKLSPAKKSFVHQALLRALEDKQINISIIGLSLALSAYRTNGPNNTVAERLFLFVVKNTDLIHRLIEESPFDFCEANAMQEQYANKLFTALQYYQYTYTPAQKNMVIFYLIERNNISVFRHGIYQLRLWFSPSLWQDLETRLLNHPERRQLILEFHPWFTNRDYRRLLGFKSAEISSEFQEAFMQCCDSADNEVFGDCRYERPMSTLLLTVFEICQQRSTSDDFFVKLQHHLNTLLADVDNESREETLINFYHAISHLMISSLNASKNMPTMARHLLESSKSASYAAVYGIHAALCFDLNLTDADRHYIRATLLQVILDEGHSGNLSCAINALHLYVKHAPYDELPEIMTALLAMQNFNARITLFDIMAVYREQRPRAQAEQIQYRVIM